MSLSPRANLSIHPERHPIAPRVNSDTPKALTLYPSPIVNTDSTQKEQSARFASFLNNSIG